MTRTANNHQTAAASRGPVEPDTAEGDADLSPDPAPTPPEAVDEQPDDAAPVTPTSWWHGWARRRWTIAAFVVVALLAAGVAVRVATRSGPDASAGGGAAGGVSPSGADPLGADIAGIQAQLAITPNNADAWASLGLDYVQEAKNTVNPLYYPKAEGALNRSLQIAPQGNAAGLAGMAALRAAQHRFTDSLGLAQQAQALNPDSPTIYGTLADAYTQLGRYDDAQAAVQHMLDRHPGTPAYTRAEYVYELAGQVGQARDMLDQALTDASAPSDVAFCHYYLAELAFNSGDPDEALRQIQVGTTADPRYPELLEGQAKAEAALGRTDAAVADYAQVVANVPLPQYVIEAGEYLQSVGRTADAERDYRLFDAENTLFTSNGVALDTDPTLFYADRGDPARALKYGQAGIAIRPFLEMDDAYAWALHVNHRDAEALTWANKAAATGMRNALFAFHKGMIENALGDTAAARADLTTALAINPHFNPLHAPEAHATLTTLGGPR